MELSIATFNIRNGHADDGDNSWPHRKHRCISAIHDLDADLVGLQEATDFQLEDILSRCPRYASVGVGRDDGKRAGEFNPILYDRSRFRVDSSQTFWLSDTPHVPGSSSWGNENVRICTRAQFFDIKGKRAFTFWNTHLDHESQFSREMSLMLILQGFRSGQQDAILVGDFNVTANNSIIKAAVGAGLTDAVDMFDPATSLAGSFHGFTGIYEPGKIDYIFCSRDWSIEETEIRRGKIDGGWPSDHAPVRARLAQARELGHHPYDRMR